jgi:hypothetical protein
MIENGGVTPHCRKRHPKYEHKEEAVLQSDGREPER